MITDFSASIIAEFFKKRNLKLESFDIEMLDFLKNEEKPLSIKMISEKANLEEKTAIFIIKRLEKFGLCKSNSPYYVITPQGKKLLNICYKFNSRIEQSVSKNEYFNDFARLSKSIIG